MDPISKPHDPLQVERLQRFGSVMGDLTNRLMCSEWCLIELMVQGNTWPAGTPVPQNPPADYETIGYLECGTFRFLIENTQYITANVSSDVINFLNMINGFLTESSNLTYSAYQTLGSSPLVGPDGSMLGTNLFETYDQNWIVALYNMLVTDWRAVYDEDPTAYYNSSVLPIPDGTYQPIKIRAKDGSNIVKIGLLSDWGSGSEAATKVMSTLTIGEPDCLIHLGDVYYSGSPITDPGAAKGDDYLYQHLGEEQNCLVSQWPPAYEGRSFTLNSNHEMYCGAYGLFVDALRLQSPSILGRNPFSAQKGYSIFALSVGDWTLLGLDSAFNGTSSNLFMQGDLGPTQPPQGEAGLTQIQWIQQLMSSSELRREKIIVLTHHTGFDFDCSATTQASFAPFWQQVSEALGGDPYAWYWGHTHNGIVYTKPVTILPGTQEKGALPLFHTETYCRCLGHGALPFGVATGLTIGKNNIEWFASNKKPNKQDVGVDLVYNGCVALGFVLDKDEQVESITEIFMSSDPHPEPFVKRIFGKPGAAEDVSFGWPGETSAVGA